MNEQQHAPDERFGMIRETLERLPLHLTDQMCKQLLLFYDLLIEKNKVMNLTAITEFPEVLEKHFLDSLSLVFAGLPEGKSIIDIGSGAGFPGIPLKIVFPDTNVLLADSLQKRVLFLQEVIEQCQLKDIQAMHGRAEDLGKSGSALREQYDLCTSRAVANLSSLAEYCIPFVKKGGIFLAYKSGNVDQELKEAEHAIALLGGKVEDILRFTLPGTDLNRSLIVVRKIQNTNKKYPRKAGLPGKQPL